MKLYQVCITNSGWHSPYIHTTKMAAMHEAFDNKFNDDIHVLINVFEYEEFTNKFKHIDNITI